MNLLRATTATLPAVLLTVLLAGRAVPGPVTG